MASSSSSSDYLIRFHRGGVFVKDPFSYDYETLSEIPNVDMGAMNFVGFVKLLVSECSSDIKQIFYHVDGLSLELGLRTLKNDEDLAKCVELGAQNDNVLDIYVSRIVFDFFDATSNSKQQVGNAEHNDDSDIDLDDVYVYDSESEESETASVDHLSDGEEEVYDARTKKPDTAPKIMFDANFLSRIYNGLPRDEYGEKDVSDEDNLSDQWPVHDPTKLMRRVLGKKYESPEQLKRALVFYALANGYKLYYKVNNLMRLLAKCCRDDKDNKCPFRFLCFSLMGSMEGSVARSWRIIGLDGLSFENHMCKGELSAARGEMGNNQYHPICLGCCYTEGSAFGYVALDRSYRKYMLTLGRNTLGAIQETVLETKQKGNIMSHKVNKGEKEVTKVSTQGSLKHLDGDIQSQKS
ncbi:hypothetical protein Tco_0517960 [Tanacetum coccineum]